MTCPHTPNQPVLSFLLGTVSASVHELPSSLCFQPPPSPSALARHRVEVGRVWLGLGREHEGERRWGEEGIPLKLCPQSPVFSRARPRPKPAVFCPLQGLERKVVFVPQCPSNTVQAVAGARVEQAAEGPWPEICVQGPRRLISASVVAAE